MDQRGLALREPAAQLEREVRGVVVEDQRRALREVQGVGETEGQEVGGDGEIEAVAVGTVFAPLAVGEEVVAAGLHLDDDDVALGAQGHQVGPAAVGTSSVDPTEVPPTAQPGVERRALDQGTDVGKDRGRCLGHGTAQHRD